MARPGPSGTRVGEEKGSSDVMVFLFCCDAFKSSQQFLSIHSAFWIVLNGVGNRAFETQKTLRRKLPAYDLAALRHPPLRSSCFRDIPVLAKRSTRVGLFFARSARSLGGGSAVQDVG